MSMMKDILRCSVIILTIRLKTDIYKVKKNQKTMPELFWLKVGAALLDRTDFHILLVKQTYS